MQLIINGKWRSPKHSKNRGLDDSHEIKEEILHRVKMEKEKLGDYRSVVGKNPDIDVNSADEIILIGARRSSYKGKIFPTGINIRNFDFVLQFAILDSEYIEITLFCPLTQTDNTDAEKSEVKFDFVSSSRVYIIPDDHEVLDTLISSILMKHHDENCITSILVAVISN